MQLTAVCNLQTEGSQTCIPGAGSVPYSTGEINKSAVRSGPQMRSVSVSQDAENLQAGKQAHSFGFGV